MLSPCIAFFDLHVNKYNQFSDKHDRLKDCLKVIDDVFKYAAHYEAETILFGGDMGDLPKWVYIEVINGILSRFDKGFKKYPNVVVYAISGNHDHNKKNYWDNPANTILTVLATAFPERFILIDNKFALNESADASRYTMVCGIPYYENKSCFDKALDAMHEKVLQVKRQYKKCKVTLLIHQTPEGIYNKHIKADTSPADPRYDVFDLVMCGHIHKPQRITDRFVVGGNPLHRDLGDVGDDKGIWLLDLANPVKSLEFISRKGRYPEFLKVKSEHITEEMQQANFIIPIMESKETVIEGSADAAQFASTLNPEMLLTNFWKQVEGTDKRLLKVGLELLQP